MRTLAGAALSAFISLAFVGSASAGTSWYVSGSAGGYFREDDTGRSNFTRTATVLELVPPTQPPPSSPGDVVVTGGRPQLVPVQVTYHATGTEKFAHAPGETASLAVGRRFGDRLRVEVEAGYTTYASSDLRPYTADLNFPALDGRAFRLSSGGQYSRETATLNAFYNLPLKASPWTPYVGFGAGAAATLRTPGYFADAAGGRFREAGGSGVSGLALGEVGLNLALAPNLTLSPAYRYVRYFNTGGDVAHVLKASLRYAF